MVTLEASFRPCSQVFSLNWLGAANSSNSKLGNTPTQFFIIFNHSQKFVAATSPLLATYYVANCIRAWGCRTYVCKHSEK